MIFEGRVRVGHLHLAVPKAGGVYYHYSPIKYVISAKAEIQATSPQAYTVLSHVSPLWIYFVSHLVRVGSSPE